MLPSPAATPPSSPAAEAEGAALTVSSVTVVIPSWNGQEHLAPCLDSVAAEGVKVLVVDNGSDDQSRDLLEQRGVRCLPLPTNVGFARAVNLGVAETESPLVLVLNVDTVIARGCIERLVAALNADRSLGGVQPRILQHDSDGLLYSAGQRLLRDGRAFETGAGRPDAPAYREPREVFGVCGAACLLRRELFTSLGGYNEQYFIFWEDVDLNARARLAGWRFGYVPDAVVEHHGAATWKKVPRPAFNARLVARNRLATSIKVLPARFLHRAAIAEVGSVLRSVPRGTLRPTARGKLEALRRLRPLLAARRQLRAGADHANLERWLDSDPWDRAADLLRRAWSGRR